MGSGLGSWFWRIRRYVWKHVDPRAGTSFAGGTHRGIRLMDLNLIGAIDEKCLTRTDKSLWTSEEWHKRFDVHCR